MRKLLLPILVFALVLGSCSDDLTSLNDNPRDASQVPTETLFSNALVELGTLHSEASYNYNIFKFMPQYWSETTYYDETQYNLTSRTIPSNYWGWIYRDVLKDLNESSKLIEENQSKLVSGSETIPAARKKVMQAQIDLIQIMAYHKMISIFGDVPYSGALDIENPSIAYDKDEVIYKDLMDQLDTAIQDLQATNAGFISSADIFYDGDIAVWIKFANSLKMRMGIQLTQANVTVDGTNLANLGQQAVEDASPNAFDSNRDNLAIKFTNVSPNSNPIWEWIYQSGRKDFLPAKPLIDAMNNLNDPRRQIHFTQYDTTGDGVGDAYIGAPYGTGNNYAGPYSHLKGPLVEKDFEGMMLDYAEVEFIRAEAAQRGWNVSGTAETHYNQGIMASMEYWSDASSDDNISTTDMGTYLAQPSVAYPTVGSNSDQLKVIATQKWFAHYANGGLSAWTDWRRLDHPTFSIANQGAVDVSSEDDIPSRFTYPIDEQNLNEENWKGASSSIGEDTKTQRLFWDTEYATGAVD